MSAGLNLDRLTGLAFLLIGVGAMWHSHSLNASFSSDPVGPKVFPLIVGGITAISGAVVMLRPLASDWESGRWVRLIIVSLASMIYPLFLIPLGFVVATSLLLIVIARALDGRWIASGIASVATSGAIFVLIDLVLGLPLPAASWGF